MSAVLLLSRLQKVKANGSGRWMACCPAHLDRNPSLSIREESDSRVLIQCFAGCETRDVLNAVGLDWDDVMPPKPVYQRAKPIEQRIYPSDGLKLVQFESRIVMLAAMDLSHNRPLSEKDLDRLKLAVERINTIAEAANV
jgi:hypothetical protein